MKFKSIAVDGPSGAGKSTLARMLAQALGFLYVDTGAIYRTVGLAAFQNGIPPEEAERIVPLLSGLSIELKHGEDGLQHMYLDGEDVSSAIRRHEISRYASAVSALPAVRTFLLQMQRDLAARQNVIMDGRDIGTVVLPNADVKVFLTATAEDRARRRHAELLERGQDCKYETILHDVIVRDEKDINRGTAPLKRAEDALLVDTTGNTLEQSFDSLLQAIKERLQA